jgi:hypothetical protein
LGDAFSGYHSTNGHDWVAFGSAIIPMNTSVQAGLAVVSGTSNSLALASFERVLLEPLSATSDEWQQWMFAARGATNVSLMAPQADPDGDGRSNWAEYCLGSDPLAADTARALTVAGLVNGSTIALRFTERKNAEAYGRRFCFSTDLTTWTAVTPASNIQLRDLGSVVVREVTFPALAISGFYRADYGL